MGIRDYGLPTLTSMIGVGEDEDVEATAHAAGYDDRYEGAGYDDDPYRAAVYDDPYAPDGAEYDHSYDGAEYDDDPYRTAVYGDPYSPDYDEPYAEDGASWAAHASRSGSSSAEPRSQRARRAGYDTSATPEDEFAADCLDVIRKYQAAGQAGSTQLVRAPKRSAGGAIRSRAVALSCRLVELGNARPVIRIPGTLHAPWRRSRLGDTVVSAKLPPVWLLVNVMILLAAGLAVFPQVTAIHPPSVCGWYTVAPGDTLNNISTANHTNTSTVAKANDISKPDRITVGQRLCVPLAPGVHVIAPPAAPRTTGHILGVQPFIDFSLPFARRAHDQTGWPVSMILAQWGLEHGWKLPGYTGYNFGNCGAVPGEPTVGGINVPGSPAAFAYAPTAEDGLRIYVHVAHLSYYSAIAPTAASQGVDAAARALGRSPWDAGHYTNHNDPGSSLIAILHNFNLYRYD